MFPIHDVRVREKRSEFGKQIRSEEKVLELESQFAPDGNRKNNPNLLNR